MEYIDDEWQHMNFSNMDMVSLIDLYCQARVNIIGNILSKRESGPDSAVPSRASSHVVGQDVNLYPMSLACGGIRFYGFRSFYLNNIQL